LLTLKWFGFCFAGFPETGQGKEETRTGKNKRNIWNQQRQVIGKNCTMCI